MASTNGEQSVAGRRTRSSKRSLSPEINTSPVRMTRRSVKKQAQIQLNEANEPETPHAVQATIAESACAALIEDQANVKEIVPDAAPSVRGRDILHASDIPNNKRVVVESLEDISKNDNCIIYEEQVDQQVDVDMYVIQEEEQVNHDTTANSANAMDEKSSSFPFGNVIQSETSEEIPNEENDENNSGIADGVAENSLLVSLAGDNANSLPSVGGGEEVDNKKEDDFMEKTCVVIVGNNTKAQSDDSLSEPAIAEDIVGDIADTSNATIVNTELVSEDELPMPTKPEINDAEEVSDDELPAPQRAELPPDAEVISEDELPSTTAGDKKSPNFSLQAGDCGGGGQKRKADDIDSKVDCSGHEKGHKSSDAKEKMSEQYNPMSPTSEGSESPPVEKKAKIEDICTDHKEQKKIDTREREKEKERKRLPDLDKYWRSVKEDPADFTGWTYLLQYVDNESDAEAAREAYDAFLSHYPYCYGYWRKYADYEKRKGVKSNCNAVFERGLEAIPLSVDLWIHYLAHVKCNNGDLDEYVRNQFERAVNACGLEFRSDKLWDAYIKWENDNKRYHHMVKIYDQLLAIPTQSCSGHFDNFQDLINQHPITSTISTEEIIKLRADLRDSLSSPSSRTSKGKDRRAESKEKDVKSIEKDSKDDSSISGGGSGGGGQNATKDLEREPLKESANIANAMTEVMELDSDKEEKLIKEHNLCDLSTLTESEIVSIKDRVIAQRRKVHKATVAAVTARWTFEEGIKRPYFHVKPLERCQLKNWKDYLDFEIEKGDRRRILVLFERCLIACALYDEFWLKMIRYLETQLDQPGVPAIASDAYRRACVIHHPDKPSLHLMWSAYEECQNNFDKAAEVLVNIERKCPNLLQIAYRRINIERRRGDMDKCKELYEHYIANAKNKTIAGSLAIKYARFLNKICNDIDGGLRVLRQTLEKDAGNTRVALQMIDLTLQRPTVDEGEVVVIMDKFMARDNIDPEQKVLFAQRKVEFLEDFGGSAKGLQDAQRGLQLALNKANEIKKKRENSPSRKASSMNTKEGLCNSSVQSSAAYNNGAAAANANYNYNSSNSAYYGQQNSGAYQQQQQPYDGYYNQWQYGSGYSGYSQWGGYGNYY